MAAAALARVQRESGPASYSNVSWPHADGSVRVAVTGAAPAVFRASAVEAALAKTFTAEAAKGASLLVVCHPCNPTGVIYRNEELQALGRLAEQYDFHVLADEAYDHIIRNAAALQRIYDYIERNPGRAGIKVTHVSNLGARESRQVENSPYTNAEAARISA